jgi:hypothetical protein
MGNPPRKPNLFIIGAMKSGTTSLHEYLNTHPQIAMSEVKEPGFFVEELALRRGEEWYLSLFKTNPCYRYIGESSTHYTKLPDYRGVAERIFQFNPKARLIYIMRNPFERTISHYWHAVRDTYHGGERRSLLRAVAEAPEYLAFGDYAMQLEPYLRLFGRNSVFTLTFEALIRDPRQEIDRIVDWLGLTPYPIGVHTGKPHNQKPQKMIGVAGAGMLNRIERSKAWARLSPHVPMPVKNFARKLAYKSIDEDRSTQEVLELKKVIADQQKRQVENLSRLLGRSFPEWADQ